MSLAQLLATAVELLDRHGIPYMITGSVAGTFHGAPRATLDLDIVIDPDRRSMERLVGDLTDAGFYVDRDAALGALRERALFNAIGPEAEKIDFIVRKARPFSVEELRRRRPADLLGTPAFIVSAEDAIIAKLEWASLTDSERQLRDVGGILETAGSSLDLDYVERWVSDLGLANVWQKVHGAV